MLGDMDNFVYSMVGGGGTTNIEVGPKYWFVKDYYLYVHVGSIMLTTHVGDVAYDDTKPLKIRIELPLKGE
jgi:hypothetical protein